jgi:hypothetical protein
MDHRWVYQIKRNPDQPISRFKARLVVRGFRQQYGVDYDETFASVCCYESVKLMLTIAATRKYNVKTTLKLRFFTEILMK